MNAKTTANVQILKETPFEIPVEGAWPFVAAISLDGVESDYIEYIIANEQGHVVDLRAWDEEKGPQAQVEDDWFEHPFDAAGFREYVQKYANGIDPRDWARTFGAA